MTECHTYTHNVLGGIRVECQEHPRFVVDVRKSADKSAREQATEAQREHEAGRL